MSMEMLQLTDYLRIADKGHIFYSYEDTEEYISNAVSYIVTGVRYGHHILLVERFDMYTVMESRLRTLLEPNEYQNYLHYIDNQTFYRANGDFCYTVILSNFLGALAPLLQTDAMIRTWAHVEWTDQENIRQKLDEFEHLADDVVQDMGVMSVCAYDATKIAPSLLARMLKSHQFYMTDTELVQSPSYQRS